MSRIVTTKLGRFRSVTDGTKKWWLWECPNCKTWANLSEAQWDGRISVYCEAPVRNYHGLDPLSVTDMKPCGYHETHEYAKELVASLLKPEYPNLKHDLVKAANRIEALAARVAKLEEALRPFVKLANEIEQCAASMPEGHPARDPDGWAKGCTWDNLKRARAALGEAS